MADSEEKIMRGAENCKDIHISFLSLLYAGHDFYAIITIFITEKMFPRDSIRVMKFLRWSIYV